MAKINYPMLKKRGQVDPFTLGVGVLVLGGVLLFGIIGTHKAIESTRYMFDPTTNTTYDLIKCKSEQVPQSALSLRGGLNEIAAEIHYREAVC
mgnify:CR=1 FL=1